MRRAAGSPRAREPFPPPTLVITRKTSQRLFDFSLRLTERRKKRGKAGLLTCVDKANVFRAYAFFRKIFDECAARYPDVATDRIYVDACSAMLVKRPALDRTLILLSAMQSVSVEIVEAAELAPEIARARHSAEAGFSL